MKCPKCDYEGDFIEDIETYTYECPDCGATYYKEELEVEELTEDEKSEDEEET